MEFLQITDSTVRLVPIYGHEYVLMVQSSMFLCGNMIVKGKTISLYVSFCIGVVALLQAPWRYRTASRVVFCIRRNEKMFAAYQENGVMFYLYFPMSYSTYDPTASHHWMFFLSQFQSKPINVAFSCAISSHAELQYKNPLTYNGIIQSFHSTMEHFILYKVEKSSIKY